MTFNIGDVVRVGKGKVLYTVTWTPQSVGYTADMADVEVQSHNTGNLSRVAESRLVLVEAHPEIAEVIELQPESAGLASYLAGREPLFSEEEQAKIMRDVDKAMEDAELEPVVETSAYAKAVLFALNKLGKHVYAGTVRKNVKAKRRGLNARQKASRKANR